MANQGTRKSGEATRIYKNADDEVLAIDCITVTTDSKRITNLLFHHSSTWTSKRDLLYLGSADRVVSKILMLGDFNSITVDGGDYLTATWNGATTSENNATMLFEDLAQIGDTV